MVRIATPVALQSFASAPPIIKILFGLGMCLRREGVWPRENGTIYHFGLLFAWPIQSLISAVRPTFFLCANHNTRKRTKFSQHCPRIIPDCPCLFMRFAENFVYVSVFPEKKGNASTILTPAFPRTIPESCVWRPSYIRNSLAFDRFGRPPSFWKFWLVDLFGDFWRYNDTRVSMNRHILGSLRILSAPPKMT